MTYLIAVCIALSVGMVVWVFANLLPAQARPSRSRLAELGLEESLSRVNAGRRNRAGRRVQDVLIYLGQRMESPRKDWSPTRERLVHAGLRQPLALQIFLGSRLAADGLLYF
jgi:hypothetical protein